MKFRYTEEYLIDKEVDPLEVLRALPGESQNQVALLILDSEIDLSFLAEDLVGECKRRLASQVVDIVRDEVAPMLLRNIKYWVDQTDISKCTSVEEVAAMFLANPKV